jgi:hypothetical protein
MVVPVSEKVKDPRGTDSRIDLGLVETLIF